MRKSNRKQTPTGRTRIAACVVQLEPGATEVQLLPDGTFRATDGRPFDADAWQLDAVIARGVIERAAERANDLVIDYEHQTLLAEINGQPAPAAGWFKQLEFREGAGLFATDVRWTARARQLIEAEEYRYLSAVFRYLPDTGEIREILHAGITNTPALDGMNELSVRAAARFSFHEDQQEAPTVELEELLELLGIQKDADEETIKTACAALKTKAGEVDELKTSVAALKAAADKPDPAKFVPIAVVEGLQTQIAELSQRMGGDEVEALVKGALEEGKLLPAHEDWARELGKQNVAALKGYLEKAAPIAALKGTQTGGKQPDGEQEGKLSETELAVCRQMGLSEEDFLKAKGK